ncbi:hypothetical protein T03_15577 [Trichinella britovi]|uniref:Uncharacterized protein n=1 Tax=Trichinella britovi TaxID=45882 RepID=A0A0V1AHK1_TRIBR|nr:hypothetical protein T03_15577 [Trichinella britovi]
MFFWGNPERLCFSDLLLFPSYPHHWFTGLLLLHMNPPQREIMSLMKTLIVDCFGSRGPPALGMSCAMIS